MAHPHSRILVPFTIPLATCFRVAVAPERQARNVSPESTGATLTFFYIRLHTVTRLVLALYWRNFTQAAAREPRRSSEVPANSKRVAVFSDGGRVESSVQHPQRQLQRVVRRVWVLARLLAVFAPPDQRRRPPTCRQDARYHKNAHQRKYNPNKHRRKHMKQFEVPA